eukprot:m.19530 g.19530  ORF g.19530 m.19530 type:complete len:88 (+) comp12496_c0_seq1:311-574(+)
MHAKVVSAKTEKNKAPPQNKTPTHQKYEFLQHSNENKNIKKTQNMEHLIKRPIDTMPHHTPTNSTHEQNPKKTKKKTHSDPKIYIKK